MNQIVTHATVQLTVAIKIQQPWSDDCSIGQIHKQAISNANDTVRKLLSCGSDAALATSLIGEPKVIMTTSERQ